MARQETPGSGGHVDLLVTAELDGARVDKALAVLLGVSRSVASGLLKEGVTIDGRVVRPSDRVASGQLLTSPVPRPLGAVEAEPVDFGVLYEDPDVIVVDKPPGVVVHPGAGRRTGTLAAGLLFRFPELRDVGEVGRWGLVHRLDKDTSGALLVARTPEALRVLQRELKARRVRRVYTALAHGAFAAPTGTIEAPIGPDPGRPMIRAVTPSGKPATTHYSVLGHFESPDCTLLEVRLETGRTHQIRVHLAAIGHPVVGDPVYGSVPRRAVSPRIFLHASGLEFEQPRTGEPVAVSSPLPADLAGVLQGLGGS